MKNIIQPYATSNTLLVQLYSQAEIKGGKKYIIRLLIKAK